MNVKYEPSGGRLWVVSSTTFTPVSEAMAWTTAGEVPSSVKIAFTLLSLMACETAARSAAETPPWEEILGISTPASLKP